MTWGVKGKTILVTGATSGIGLEASVELARRGAKVIMVGRNPEKARGAVEDVRSRSGATDTTSILCDFTSQAEIRKLADDYRARHDRLDVLVNNAGAVYR